MKYFKHKGPLTFYRCRNKKDDKNFLDIYLTRYENSPWGWEWGSDNNEFYMGTILRVFGLTIFGFRNDKKGFEIRFLGFWWLK